MKKLLRTAALLGAAIITLSSSFLFSSCSDQDTQDVLRVYNWEDYIDPDMITAFEEEYDCIVEYSTFGTNENMYNELKINEGSYDLVCPSDYMIMKMINEGMCQPFSEEFKTSGAYAQNVSPYIQGIFEDNGWSDYAVGYMWGTMGFMYNPETVKPEDVSSWTVLEKEDYYKKSTLKNSVRDTYFYALACVYQDELTALAEDFENGELTADEYNAALSEIMNRTDAETVEKARTYLREIKKNVYGFEVDSGKKDMVTGKIDLNLCWSGDAAYGMW
ncbi:MAG: ABC transporter substrate-binding protein, partial [Clostridia bacterium]|nr:ABC transporter substrate-binding protein [Clostridia bacterium]